jgi:hypothetical protein
MMKRAGLPAALALLVVLLGTQAVAQEPSPEATPLTAPADLTLLLPRSVGERTLQPSDQIDGAAVAERVGLASLQDLLLPLQKELDDVRFAEAVGEDLIIIAVRIDGVDPEPLQEEFLATFGFNGRALPNGIMLRPSTVEGRPVGQVVDEDMPGPWASKPWGWTFTSGDVFLAVFGILPLDGFDIEDVLTQLP